MNTDTFEFFNAPCDEAFDWLKSQRDIKSAWENCQKGTWMLWAIQYSTNARKITDGEMDALIVWLRTNIFNDDYINIYVYAPPPTYAHYACVNASGPTRSYAYYDAKIANWVRANIRFPW